MTNPTENLAVSVEGDQIVIRLPIGVLQHAVEACPELDSVDEEGEFTDPIITDLAKFASEVVRELQCEDEDGTTPVHRMFDGVFLSAVEGGAEGIEVYGNDDYPAAVAARLSKEG